MSEESEAAKCAAFQMNQGSAGVRASSSDISGGHVNAAADAPPGRKVLKARRPSAAQAVAAHGIAAAAAPAAVPAAAIPKGQTAADARAVAVDVQYVDHYLCRAMPIVLFINHRRVLVNVDQLLLPCHLVHAAAFFHAQHSRRPPPRLPRYMQLQFQPLQLQRFLRSCVLATAHALATPPASVCRLVHARTRSRWIDCIFVRVMRGFVAKAEVRRQAARLCFASARMIWRSRR